MRGYEPRIVPWRSRDELKELKNWLFPNKNAGKDMRSRGVLKIKSWETKGPFVPHTIEATGQLLEAILMDEAEQGAEGAKRLAYTMAMVRFVNGLLDPTQQSQFAIPLHTLAQRMGLPSWFVELRHCGTHERELPSLEMLRMASLEALEWLWTNYWNADEMKDNGDTGDAEVAEDTEVFEITAVSTVISEIPAIADLMNAGTHIWKHQRVSSSFTGEEPASKKAKHVESPEKRVERFVGNAKEAWKATKSQPDVFIEEFMLQYEKLHAPVLKLLAERIHPFGYELCRWTLEAYGKTLKEGTSVLRRKFDATRLQKFLSGVCDAALDPNRILTHAARWTELLRENPNYVSLTLLQSITSNLEKLGDKTRRRFTNEAGELRALAERLAARTSASELELYQIAGKPRRRAAEEIHKSTTPVPSTAAAILDDLAQLRQRRRPRLWQPVPNWTPRPFGQA